MEEKRKSIKHYSHEDMVQLFERISGGFLKFSVYSPKSSDTCKKN